VNRVLSVALASLLAGYVFISHQDNVLAQEKNRISASEAQGQGNGGVALKISPYGLIVSFEEVGEFISKYWATDDTHLRVGTNAPIGRDATILFLKTEGQWPSDTDGTTLTVMTKRKSGDTQLYSFFIEFTKEKPKYPIVRIFPDEAPPKKSITKVQTPEVRKPAQTVTPDNRKVVRAEPSSPGSSIAESQKPPRQPFIVKKPVAVQSMPIAQKTVVPKSVEPPRSKTPKVKTLGAMALKIAGVSRKESAVSQPPKSVSAPQKSVPEPKAQSMGVRLSTAKLRFALIHHYQANALIRGLLVASRTGEVGSKSTTTSRVQNVARRLRRGEDLAEASKQESVEWKTVVRLLKLGNYAGMVESIPGI
jgi:hypothetical protein